MWFVLLLVGCGGEGTGQAPAEATPKAAGPKAAEPMAAEPMTAEPGCTSRVTELGGGWYITGKAEAPSSKLLVAAHSEEGRPKFGFEDRAVCPGGHAHPTVSFKEQGGNWVLVPQAEAFAVVRRGEEPKCKDDGSATPHSQIAFRRCGGKDEPVCSTASATFAAPAGEPKSGEVKVLPDMGMPYPGAYEITDSKGMIGTLHVALVEGAGGPDDPRRLETWCVPKDFKWPNEESTPWTNYRMTNPDPTAPNCEPSTHDKLMFNAALLSRP